jgi:hypothetical protein
MNTRRQAGTRSPASGEMLIVGSCHGWHPIPADQEDDYYRAFAWASALGAGLLCIFAFGMEAWS